MTTSIAGTVRRENPVYRKIAWRLMPMIWPCFILANVDRFNIAFAKLQFLHDLGLDDAVYGFAAGIFYVGYVTCEVPSNLWLEKIGVRRTLLRIMVLWGSVTCLFMFADRALHFYVLRLLLGIAEAGFFPGMLFYMTCWFPDRLRGRMTSLFVMAVPVGGVIAGPVSGWVMENMQGVAGFHGWQWLFVIEGVPAILFGIVAFLYLSDKPASATWLSDEEKQAVAADLTADQAGRREHSESFWHALKDPRLYLLALSYFGVYCMLSLVSLWIPTVLKGTGNQSVGVIGWISGGISLASTVGMILIGLSSDKRLERRWHAASCGFATAAALVILPLAARNIYVTALLLSVASVGIFSVLSLFWTIASGYLSQSVAAGAIALISSIGALGGAVSPAVIGMVKVKTGSLYVGFDIFATLLAIGMLILLIGIPNSNQIENKLKN